MQTSQYKEEDRLTKVWLNPGRKLEDFRKTNTIANKNTVDNSDVVWLNLAPNINNAVNSFLVSIVGQMWYKQLKVLFALFNAHNRPKGGLIWNMTISLLGACHHQ